MKTIVFAYHNMGVIGIKRLIEAGYDIRYVFTHEDNAVENIWFDSVYGLCQQVGLECIRLKSSNSPCCKSMIKAANPDIMFSFYYRELLSREVLEIPRSGAYNLHGSYLPAYRGRCPVNWVIINGEKQTGVTLHEMMVKPDAGPIVAQKKVTITHNDTALSLFRKLEQASDTMLADILPQIKIGEFLKTPQRLIHQSYYGGRKPEDGRISWEKSAEEIYNLVRGVTWPYPGAFCYQEGKKMILWRILPGPESFLEPGRIRIDDNRVLFGTVRGSMEAVDVEIEGKKLKGSDLLNYFKNHEGEYLQ